MSRGTDVTDIKRNYRTKVEKDFPDNLIIEIEKESELRYGENPNQPAAMFRLKLRAPEKNLAKITNIRLLKSGKGGLSATNYMDIASALNILKYFEVPAVAVMKHLVPSGFARQFNGSTLEEIYRRARDTDTRSSFGSVVVLNKPVDKSTAEAIMSSYVEVVAAPEFEEGTTKILERKKDIRCVLFSNIEKLPKFAGDDVSGFYDIRCLQTGRVLVQKPYLSSIRCVEDLILDPFVEHEGVKHLVARDPTERELEDLLTAWYVNLGVKSNGIVFVKEGATVAVGTGQQERVGAIEQAIIKAYQKAMDREKIKYDFVDGAAQRESLSANPLEGAVMSSDAFLPFPDSINIIARHGVTAVIQPGGSIRDHEVIDAVNNHGLAMAYTLERCFLH